LSRIFFVANFFCREFFLSRIFFVAKITAARESISLKSLKIREINQGIEGASARGVAQWSAPLPQEHKIRVRVLPGCPFFQVELCNIT
jgi:hypothetical protein